MAVRSNRNSSARPPQETTFNAQRRAGEAVEHVVSMAMGSPLHLHYSPSSELVARPGQMPLAEVRFAAEPTLASGPHPYASIAMDQLDGAARVELWLSDLPVQYGQVDSLRYAKNSEVLFGVISKPSIVGDPDFENQVHQIYQQIFALTESEGYPHLLRVWNYFPRITADSDGLENYQRFCRARSLAFQKHSTDFIQRLPSASAVGTHGGAFVMYFIAAREPGVHRENPRQMSAYSYPPQYGPRSPSFARATLKRFDQRECFFISGTASIVGHESLHVGDMRAQLEETLCNIEALIESTKRDEATRFQTLLDLSHIKVYLRHAADLGVARETIQSRIGAGTEVLYLLGDICRRELLVEIEAVIGIP